MVDWFSFGWLMLVGLLVLTNYRHILQINLNNKILGLLVNLYEWSVYLGMSEFCDSVHAEFCMELAVMRRVYKVAQKMYNFCRFCSAVCDKMFHCSVHCVRFQTIKKFFMHLVFI